MNCNEFQNAFLNIDNRTEITRQMQMHLKQCAKCSRIFDEHTLSYKKIAVQAPFVSPVHSSAIIDNILATDPDYAAETPIRPWLIAGFMLILGVFITGNSSNFSWMKTNGGENFEITLEFVLGFLISGYVFIFVMTHMKKAKSFMRNGRFKATLYR